MNTITQEPEAEKKLRAGITKRFVQVFLFLVLQTVVLFAGSGQLSWIWAWLYLGICLVIFVVNATLLLRASPETLAERGEARFTEKWDKIVVSLYSLFLFLLVPLVAALDVRFGWTGNIQDGWHIVGAIGVVAGFAIGAWAMLVNAYFSTAVRIQTDRGHTVCRSGPYRFVRHPGYVGFIVQSVATPVLLGSVWGLLPGLAAGVMLIIRTLLEDRTLRRELSGYEEYAHEVRYRLLPGIW